MIIFIVFFAVTNIIRIFVTLNNDTNVLRQSCGKCSIYTGFFCALKYTAVFPFYI
nr:MAG TPA: NADH-ubiquinone oxidoreductase [Caudoviricetes sp.]